MMKDLRLPGDVAESQSESVDSAQLSASASSALDSGSKSGSGFVNETLR